MQCQLFLEKTFKEDVIICSPGVKHVWDLNVTSNTYFNMHWVIVYIQAGLLCQDYIPEKFHTNQTQNSNLKQCISWGLGDWHPHPIKFMIIPWVDIETCRVYMYCIYSIFTSLCSIHKFMYKTFIYFWCSKNVSALHPQFLVRFIPIRLW